MSNCKRYTESELQQLLSDGIAELQQKNKALLRDKARLDWLADVNNNIGNVLLPRDIVERNLGSLRDGIDEAMLIESPDLEPV